MRPCLARPVALAFADRRVNSWCPHDTGGEIFDAQRRRLAGVGATAWLLRRHDGRCAAARHPEPEDAGRRPGLPHDRRAHDRAGDVVVVRARARELVEHVARRRVGRRGRARVPRQGREHDPRAGRERARVARGGRNAENLSGEAPFSARGSRRHVEARRTGRADGPAARSTTRRAARLDERARRRAHALRGVLRAVPRRRGGRGRCVRPTS